MSSRAPGFSLVEVLIVALLATVIMGAVYETLTVQQRSARQIGVITGTQQTVRTAVQYLQSELREIGARPGDIRGATTTRITFRALRKVAFACTDAGATVDVYTYGDRLVAGDTLDIYADGGTSSMADDQIVRAVVSSVAPTNACPAVTGSPWTSMSQNTQRLGLTAIDPIVGIKAGAAIRSFRTVTYGIYSQGGTYVLGRQESPPDTVVALIGPLARNGLEFAYWKMDNTAIAPTNLAGSLDAIARIRITVRGRTPGAATPGGTYSDSLVTDVFLRGN